MIAHPDRASTRAAKANQERCASIVPSCSYCGDHTILDRVTHMVCADCIEIMERAADQDADDRGLVLMAIRAYRQAVYDCAVRPSTEGYEAIDRAYVRVLRLLDRALEQAEPSRPRPSDERRTLVQGEEDAGVRHGNAVLRAPAKGSGRPSARSQTKTPTGSHPAGVGDDTGVNEHAVTLTEGNRRPIMEANAIMDAPESVDRETTEYAAEMERHMPQGEGPTDQELRADYLLEKMAEEQEKLDHLNEFTERRIQMIRDHAEIETLRIRRRMDWLESKVRMCVPYDPDQFQNAYGKKSLKLPHGQLGYRSSRESVAILDKDKALAWAKANGVEIKTTESVNKTPILDAIQKTGEVPDLEECGFEIMPATDSFFVKAGS